MMTPSSKFVHLVDVFIPSEKTLKKLTAKQKATSEIFSLLCTDYALVSFYQ